jgi:hypothetical protein
MADANTSLQVSELGFFEIKENLKSFLRAKPELTDFDFEGSTMSTLLDVLAYNTYYNSFYLNMVANEMFLDSAIMKESTYSLSKMMNYTPRSARAASASLVVSFTPTDSPAEIVIPQYTKFSTTIDGVNYYFTTDTEYSVQSAGGVYVKTITIYEGQVLSYRFTVDASSKFFELPVAGVDTESMKVQVQPSAGSTTLTTYTLVKDSTEVAATSTVYYLQKNSNGFYELYFGDGVLGAALQPGNIVVVTFRACNGGTPNNASNFQKIGYTGYNKAVPTTKYICNIVSVAQKARDGQDEETIDSIKFNAPRNFEMQNRLITAGDYKNYILANYSDIQAVNVWGGETHNPPLYGKTIIAVKPFTGYVITNNRKTTIINDIKKFNPMSIDPAIIDPVFIFVKPVATVNYNSSVSTLEVDAIFNKIATAVQNFESTQLGIFGNRFKLSRLSTAIDNSDASVESNQMTITIEKRFAPVLNSKFNYNIDYQNPLYNPYAGYQGCISSNGFNVAGSDNTLYLDDDGNGVLRLYYLNGTAKTYFNTTAGTVDYSTGQLSLQSFIFTDYNEEVVISAQPLNTDIYAQNNQIILLSTPTISMFDTSKNKIIFNKVVDVVGNSTLIDVDGVSNTVTL